MNGCLQSSKVHSQESPGALRFSDSRLLWELVREWMFSCYHPVRQMSVVYNWGKDLHARLSPRPPWSFRLSFSSQISPANHSTEGSLHTRNTTLIATRFVIDTKQDTPTRALTTEEVMCVMKTHPPIPADLLLLVPLYPNIHFHVMSELVVSFEALPDFDTLQIPHFSAPHFIRYVGTGGRGVVTSGTKGATRRWSWREI